MNLSNDNFANKYCLSPPLQQIIYSSFKCFLCLVVILNIPVSIANEDHAYPLTAHGNYNIVTEHGGLSWTSENILGSYVLVIHSFHEGDNKADAIMHGIYDKFRESKEHIMFSVEFMDTKRYPQEHHIENLKQIYKYKYANKRFEAIIVSGQEALKFALKFRPEIFYNTPIVFTGINKIDLESVKNHDAITGVIESVDILATVNLALKLHHNINNLVLLAPGNNDKNILTKLKEKIPAQVQIQYWNDIYISDIEKKIESIGNDVILLPVAEPRTKSGANIPYKKFVERIAKISHAPVYSLWDTALGSGTVGGKLVSGFAQGQTAADLALKIIAGIDANDMPIVTQSPNKYMFDYLQLQSFDIRKENLPTNSEIINKPFSVYETYYYEINIAIVLVIIQAGIICLLLLVNKQRKKAENELKLINDQLESRIIKRTNELSLSEEKFSKSFLSCPDGLTITSLETGRLIEVNEAFETLSGYCRDEVIGKSTMELGIWCNQSERDNFVCQLKNESKVHEYEAQMQDKSGQIHDMSLSADIINISGESCILIIAKDITDQKRINQELRRYEKIVASTNDFISFIDKDYIYRAANKTYLDAFHLDRDELIGNTVSKIHGNKRFNKEIKPNLDRCFNGETVNVQYWVDLINIGRRYLDVIYSPYYEGDNVMGAVVSARDITPTHELSEKLSYQASHDSLTELINRREFENRLQRVLSSVKKDNDTCVLCYMDLDQFKVINDTCGHAAGDELLRQLGELLRNNIRERDTLARLGGDEFAALIEHCSISRAQRIVNKIQGIINDFRFEWENKTFRVSISIGLVPITRSSGHLDELLKQADAACYVAKNEGRNRVHIYQQGDASIEQHHGEMQWIVHVQEALDKDQFCLYKQPIQPLNDDNDMTMSDHFEVLLRLQKDDEIISPGIFLPCSEQYGLSSKIDKWVINKSFNWLTEDPNRQESLSLCTINLSGYSLGTDGFLCYIVEKLGDMPIKPEKICFEITETAAIANYEKASHFIKELRKLGCRFALDDFGSGFSSFTHLRNLDIDFLKIEGMFVRDILNDPIAYSMVKTINEIGHLFGIKTIAECVENEHILQKLKAINVDYVQGYNIGMPQPIDETTIIRQVNYQDNLSVKEASKLKH